MLNWIARQTTEHRGRVLAVLLGTMALLGSQIPNIRIDPSIQSLLSSYEGGESVADVFREEFGDSSQVLVLLLQSDDVLAEAPLQYAHDTAGYVEALPWVASLVSLTRTVFPRRIETDPAAALDDLDDLDDYDPDADDYDPDAEDDDFDPAVVDALVSLVEADPEHFPGGFTVLATGLSLEMRATPIVAEDDVTAENIDELRVMLAQNRLIQGHLISEDHTLLVTAMRLQPGEALDTHGWVAELELYLEEHPPPDGCEIRLGGMPHVRTVIADSIQSDQIFLVPMTLVVCMLLLGLFLRWGPGVYLPIVAVGITCIMVVGGMAVFGEPFNILNNIIPTLLIIIGISDSIHLIGRYREELGTAENADEDTRREAGRRTVKQMALACLLTSITTAVGLISLVVSETAMLRHFGMAAGIGVLVAYVVTITFLPTVLTWLKAPPPKKQQDGRLEGAIGSLTKVLLARPWAVLAGAALLMAACATLASGLTVDSALLDQFDPQDPVYVTTRLLEDQLDGVRPLEVSFRSSEPGRFYDPEILAAIDEITAWAEAQPEVLSAMSATAVIRQSLVLLSEDLAVWGAPFHSEAQVRALSELIGAGGPQNDPLTDWVDGERTHFRLQIRLRDVGAQATMAMLGRLETQLEDLPADIDVGFTGQAYDDSVGMSAVVGDLLSSLSLAVVIIFFLLTILFRSVRLGLLSIPSNLIPLVFTMAYMSLRGIPLNAATVIIFSISLGLAVDGSIHVLARFREEIGRGLSVDDALMTSARGTGRAIVVSGLTLMAGFAVLLLSSFVPIRRFGELIAVTVALTLFATLIVQPALLKVAGQPRAKRS